MLVLSRHRNEVICINDDIEITVVDIRGDKVRLGISAPKEVEVHRKEVYEAIQREEMAANKPVTMKDFVAKTKEESTSIPMESGATNGSNSSHPATTRSKAKRAQQGALESESSGGEGSEGTCEIADQISDE